MVQPRRSTVKDSRLSANLNPRYVSVSIDRCIDLVVPDFVVVEDDGGAKATGWVDTGSGDRNSGQVNHENGEANGQRSQDLRTKNFSLRTKLQQTT